MFHLRREVGGEGKSHTLNFGIAHVLQDDWMQALLIMDADVIYLPDSLRKLTRHLADPKVGAVTAYVAEGTSKPNYLTRFVGLEYAIAQVGARRAQNVLGALPVLAGGAQLHSRENLEAIGGRIDTTTLRRGHRHDLRDPAARPEGDLRAVCRRARRGARPHQRALEAAPALGARQRAGHAPLPRRVLPPESPARSRSLLRSASSGSASSCSRCSSSCRRSGWSGLYFLHSDLATIVFRALWIIAALGYAYGLTLSTQLDPKVGRRSWREVLLFPGLISVVIMIVAVFPGLVSWVFGVFGWTLTEGAVTGFILFAYVWQSAAMFFAWLAKQVEKTGIGRLITPLLVYLVGYGPILCAITFDSYVKEWRGVEQSWDKTEKVGRAMG